MNDRIIGDRVSVRLWADQHPRLNEIYADLAKKSQASKLSDVLRLAVDRLIKDHDDKEMVQEE